MKKVLFYFSVSLSLVITSISTSASDQEVDGRAMSQAVGTLPMVKKVPQIINQQVLPPDSLYCVQQTDEQIDGDCVQYDHKLYRDLTGRTFVREQKKRSNDDCKQELVKFLRPIALKVQSETGFPASIIIAQAALETNWGRSELLRRGNSFFGHSCWKNHRRKYEGTVGTGIGEKKITISCRIKRPDSEGGKYVSFENITDSIEAYIDNLLYDPSKNWTYKKIRKIVNIAKSKDKIAFWRNIANSLGSYSADNHYISKIKKIVTQHGLHKMDKLTSCSDPNILRKKTDRPSCTLRGTKGHDTKIDDTWTDDTQTNDDWGHGEDLDLNTYTYSIDDPIPVIRPIDASARYGKDIPEIKPIDLSGLTFEPKDTPKPKPKPEPEPVMPPAQPSVQPPAQPSVQPPVQPSAQQSNCIPYNPGDYGEGAGERLHDLQNRSIEQSRFIEKIKPIAVKLHHETGIPASIIIGEAILETGWGTYHVVKNGNSFFRHLCSKESPSTKTILTATGEKFINVQCIFYGQSTKRDHFKYESMIDSVDAYVHRILYDPSSSMYYHNFRKRIATAKYRGEIANWRKVANTLGKFAVENNYIAKLKAIIKKYKLFEIDNISICKNN